MKRLTVLFTALFLLTALSGCGAETPSLQTGEAVFGDFAAMDLDGNIVTEDVLKEKKITLINIWATFCGPCIREMPALARLSEEFSGEMQVIGIVLDLTDAAGNTLPDKKEEALRIVGETGADYLHLVPSTALVEAYLKNVMSVPETLFVDENGCILGESFMGARSEGEWRSIIETYLEAKK